MSSASKHRLLLFLASISLAHSLQSSAWAGRRGKRCTSSQLQTNTIRRTFALPRTPRSLLWSSSQDDQEEKLNKLGFAPRELQSSSRRETSEGSEPVNVNLVEDIDAVTLTAVGFGLIALNFFIFANLGDGGIGGVVAKIINLSRQ